MLKKFSIKAISVLLVALTLCAALLAGCGDTGSASVDNTSAGGAPAAEGAPATTGSQAVSTQEKNSGKNSNYELVKASIHIDNNGDGTADNPAVVYINDRRSAGIPRYIDNAYKSLDNTKALLITQEDSGYNAKGTYTLYDQDGKLIVDEDVKRARLSLNGEAVAYYANVHRDGDFTAPLTGDLMLYSNGEAEIIAEGLDIERFALSPDGKAVVYSVWDVDTQNYYGYYYYDGATYELGEGCTPSGVSNEARYIYYMDAANDGAYVMKGDGDATQFAEGAIWSSFANHDISEVIFSARSDSGGTTFICKDGNEHFPLLGDRIERMILPYNTAIDEESGVIGIQTFSNTFYTDGSSIYHINDAYEARLVLENVDLKRVFLADDGQTLTYYAPPTTPGHLSGSICQLNGGDANAKPATLVESAGYNPDMAVSVNGKAIYYTGYSEADSGDRLFHVDDKGKATKITISDESWVESLGNYKHVIFNDTLYFVFTDENGEDQLLASDGGAAKPVNGLSGNTIDQISATEHGIMLVTQEVENNRIVAYPTYYSTDGKNFNLVD